MPLLWRTRTVFFITGFHGSGLSALVVLDAPPGLFVLRHDFSTHWSNRNVYSPPGSFLLDNHSETLAGATSSSFANSALAPGLDAFRFTRSMSF